MGTGGGVSEFAASPQWCHSDRPIHRHPELPLPVCVIMTIARAAETPLPPVRGASALQLRKRSSANCG